MKPLHLLSLSILAAGTALAQAPTITAVENSATNIPPGLPNAPVAQGALFVVKGTNLGPSDLAIATKFPFTTSIGGTSVQVTVGGTTVDAIMYYSLAAQIAAILPSKTPTGTGTVKVTYNGQSVTGPITVVQNNIGIFTVSTTGSGDAIAFLNAENGAACTDPVRCLITPIHAANPGDVIVLWGTGLGPVTSDETQPAVQADMPNVPLQVFIGGKQANILFRGRNACCTAVDTVYATVPQGVTGCAVSVLMQVGNLVSNSTSIAVAASGRTCTLTNPTGSLSPGTHSFGGMGLVRNVISIPAIGPVPGMLTKMDTAAGAFVKTTPASGQVLGSQADIAAYGSCAVTTSTGQTVPSPMTGTTQYLDAGPAITLTGPGINRMVVRTNIGPATLYQATLDNTATTIVAGQYTFTGPGGADVGQFTATLNLPQPLTWTNQAAITAVDRASGVTVTWTGGDPAGYVQITGSSFVSGSGRTAAVASFTCTARASDGTFTVPPIVLLSLPPSTTVAGFSIPGTLAVTSTAVGTTFQASGLDLGGAVTSAVIYASSVPYL
jgi:uncharacterized protein (TIGR03437 family)